MPSYRKRQIGVDTSFNSIINIMKDPRTPHSNGYAVKEDSTLGMILASEVYKRDLTQSSERFIKDTRGHMMELARRISSGKERLTEEEIIEMHQGQYDQNRFLQGTTEHTIIEMANSGDYETIGKRFVNAAKEYANWIDDVNRNRDHFGQRKVRGSPGREMKCLDDEFAKELEKA